jgi:predicted RND superfamily exporter protein
MNRENNSEYQQELKNIINKGTDDFEKYIMLVATGTTVISLNMFMNIPDNRNCVVLFITGVILFFLSTILILIGHLISIDFNNKTLEELEKNALSQEKTDRRNRIITRINYCSIGLILIGFIFTIIFLFKNF